jgi:signal transduction histidine kinase
MPDLLNYRTLFLASGIASGALLMLFVVQHQKAYPGLRRMVIGLDLLAAAILIGGIRGYVSDALLTLQIITLGCFALINSGIRLVCASPIHDRWLFLYLAAGSSLQIYLYFTRPLHARIILTSILLIPLAVDAAIQLLKPAPKGCRFSYRFTAGVAILASVMSCIRIAAIMRLRQEDSPYFAHSLGNTLFFLLILLLVLALAFGITALSHERLVAELTAETEAKSRAQRELRDAQRLVIVGRLAGGVAHFFNNQMQIIGLSCSLLRQSLNNSGVIQSTSIDQIEKASKRSANITKRLLQYAQSRPLKTSRFNPKDLLNEILPQLRAIVGERIEITTSNSSKIPVVELDADALREALFALLQNARDAMPAEGRVTISLREMELDAPRAEQLGLLPSNYVLLSVEDTGSGMDEETLCHVFDPFFTTKDKATVEGLGLASAFGFLSQSGGAITVQSTVDVGSTFELYLPTLLTRKDVLKLNRVA